MQDREDVPRLTSEGIALTIFTEIFADLAAAFSRCDGKAAAEALQEVEKRALGILKGLLDDLRAAGGGKSAGVMVAAAAETVRVAVRRAKDEVGKPPH